MGGAQLGISSEAGVSFVERRRARDGMEYDVSGETTYILGETVKELLVVPCLEDLQVSALADGLLLRVVLRREGKGGRALAFSARRIEVRITGGGILTTWLDRTGRRHLVADEPGLSCLFDLLVTGHVPMARKLGPGEPGLAREPAPARSLIARATFESLDHPAVGDFMLGFDGRECSLQFQLGQGFAGISTTASLDWVGCDFDERTLDMSWFDTQDHYHITAFDLARDGAAARAAMADPIAFVLSAANRERAGAGGPRALQSRLAGAFGSPGGV